MKLSAWMFAALTTFSYHLVADGRLETFLISPIQSRSHDIILYRSSPLGQVAVVGNFIFVADGYVGLEVYDISDANPRLINEYPTGEYTSSVHVHENWAVVNDSLNGTVVFDISDPKNLRQVPALDVPRGTIMAAWNDRTAGGAVGNACVIAKVEKHIYIARDDLGLVQIDLRNSREFTPLPRFDSSEATGLQLEPSLPRVRAMQVPLVQVHLATATDATVTSSGSPDESTREEVLSEPVLPTVPEFELTATRERAGVRIRISGPPGLTVRIQRSSSPVGEWRDLSSVTLRGPPIEFPDESPSGESGTFYRAVTP